MNQRQQEVNVLTRTSSSIIYTFCVLTVCIIILFNGNFDFLIDYTHLVLCIASCLVVWTMRKFQSISLHAFQVVVMALIYCLSILGRVESNSPLVFVIIATVPMVIATTTYEVRLLLYSAGMLFITVVLWVIFGGKYIARDISAIEVISFTLINLVCYISLINYITSANRRIIKGEYLELSFNDMLKVVLMKCDEARLATKSKSSFLANMSHEIRTPINAVIGMSEMILREGHEEGIRRYAMDIKNSGKSLLSIVNDILDSSKIESGKMEIVPVEYEVASMLNDVVNMTNARVGDKNLNVEYIISSELPSVLYGDDIRIKQIFMNILSNSIKYTPAGSVRLLVDGHVEGENFILHVEVSDTGIGIKKEDIPKLFEAFERIDVEKNRSIEGTELGMSITMGLLKMMEGTLSCDSEYGKGTTFTFEIKQQIVSLLPIGDFKEKMHEAANEYNYVTNRIAPDAKILVVDDNDINRSVFKALLKQTLVKIDDVASGRECLKAVSERRYDIIFLDHMMPEMDGIETLKRMIEMPENLCDDTPVIMLTANAMNGAKEKYLAEGFDDFLSKPIVPEKLEAMLFEYLPKRLVSEVKSEKTEQQKIADSEAAANTSDESNIELPTIDEIDWDHAKVHISDGNILKETAVQFTRSIPKEIDELEQLYTELYDFTKLDLYRIKVHALKSSALVIGALVLYGVARMLEVAAKEQDIERINTLHPVLIDELMKYHERLNVLDDLVQEKPLAEKDDVIDNFDVLIQCLKDEEKDAEAISFLGDQINEFSYPDEIQQDVDFMMECIADGDYDNACALAEKIVAAL